MSCERQDPFLRGMQVTQEESEDMNSYKTEQDKMGAVSAYPTPPTLKGPTLSDTLSNLQGYANTMNQIANSTHYRLFGSTNPHPQAQAGQDESEEYNMHLHLQRICRLLEDTQIVMQECLDKIGS